MRNRETSRRYLLVNAAAAVLKWQVTILVLSFVILFMPVILVMCGIMVVKEDKKIPSVLVLARMVVKMCEELRHPDEFLRKHVITGNLQQQEYCDDLFHRSKCKEYHCLEQCQFNLNRGTIVNPDINHLPA